MKCNGRPLLLEGFPARCSETAIGSGYEHGWSELPDFDSTHVKIKFVFDTRHKVRQRRKALFVRSF